MPEIEKKQNILVRFKNWLPGLSLRTGMIVFAVCGLCYVISFVQFLFPISAGTKGVLFAVFFGLAKATQYIGIAIVGKTGIDRIKGWRKRRRKRRFNG